MAFSAVLLSESTNGRGVLIAATATAGTLIHTAHASALDEVWLWVTNTSTSAVKLTLEIGGAGAGDIIEKTVAAEAGPELVLPGVRVTGSIEIRAFAGTTNVLNLRGNVNRIT